MSIAINIGMLVIYPKRLLAVMSHDPFTTWSWEISCLNKIILSLLQQCLRPPNLEGW